MSMQIYVMTVPSGYCRIGISDDPEKRRRELQTGHHETITLLGSKIVEGDGFTVKDLERQMHSLLAHKRVRGEWFKFDGDEELAKVLLEATQRLGHPELFNANTCPCCGQLVYSTPEQREYAIERKVNLAKEAAEWANHMRAAADLIECTCGALAPYDSHVSTCPAFHE